MMIGILALILFGLMMVIGGDRGAVSVMSLAGNLLVLSLAIILMAGGHSPLIITGIAAGLISYITLVKQNGKNQKTEIRSNRDSYPVIACSNFSAFVGCKKWWIK